MDRSAAAGGVSIRVGTRFLIFDRDAKYGLEIPIAVRALKVNPARTSLESPWQYGAAERWVESCRRDLPDHMIAVDERQLRRLPLNTSATTTTTARISDWGSERQTVEFLPEPLVASCLMSDWAGCVIVTIGLPDAKRVDLKPHARTPSFVICGTRSRVAAKEYVGIGRAFLVQFGVRIQTFATGSSAIFAADHILANYPVALRLRLQNLGPREEGRSRIREIDYAVANGPRQTGKNEPSPPADLVGACPGGKFVVSRAGGAYDARDRGPDRNS